MLTDAMPYSSIPLGSAASMLLREEAMLRSTDRALLLNASDLGLLLDCARRVHNIDLFDVSFAALEHARLRLSQWAGSGQLESGRVTVCDDVFPAPGSRYDVALLLIPKERDFARAQIWSAAQALAPHGRLFLAGPNDGGIKAVVGDAETLLGAAVTLRVKSRNRVAMVTRPDSLPDYPSEWGADPVSVQSRLLATPVGPLWVGTMPGVFSWQRLDRGTAYLLEHLRNVIQHPEEAVLDVGCGNGVLGVAASRHADEVVMSDDNMLAVRCAERTIALNSAGNVRVRPSDVYDSLMDERFDLVLSNPPFHTGLDLNTTVAHRIISEAPKILKSGGRLVLVANEFLRYERLLAAHFMKSRVVAYSDQYAILEAIH